MITGTNTLVQVQRKKSTDLSKTSTAAQPETRSGTVVLQMLLGEMASLRQQVNALTVARPSSIRPKRTSGTPAASRSSRVQPDELNKVVD